MIGRAELSASNREPSGCLPGQRKSVAPVLGLRMIRASLRVFMAVASHL